MIASGGSALCAKMLGEKKDYEAKQTFTFLLLFGIGFSAIACLIGYGFREPLLYAIGSDEALYPLCEEYAVIVFIALPFALGGIIYQSFFVASGNPGLGFKLSIAGGILNIVLDYVLLAIFHMGMTGAALATSLGYIVQTIGGTIYFFCNRHGLMHFVRPKWNTKALIKSLSNGMSEMVSIMTSSVTAILMNVILMDIAGSDGVAAATIAMYMQGILASVYVGYLMGIAPVISYNYGKQDEVNLKLIYKKMRKTIGIIAIFTFFITYILAKPVAYIYASSEPEVMTMAIQCTYVFAPAFLIMGFNSMSSHFFTALNDGQRSAIISFFRTFVFLVIPMLILPSFLGIWGVWLAFPVAELCSLFLATFMLNKYKQVYHYA